MKTYQSLGKPKLSRRSCQSNGSRSRENGADHQEDAETGVYINTANLMSDILRFH